MGTRFNSQESPHIVRGTWGPPRISYRPRVRKFRYLPVRRRGLEPPWELPRQVLGLLRLPFRHGRVVSSYSRSGRLRRQDRRRRVNLPDRYISVPVREHGLDRLLPYGIMWCPRSESNRHAPHGAPTFEAGASTSSATRALVRERGLEPPWELPRRPLRPLRLPFRHSRVA